MESYFISLSHTIVKGTELTDAFNEQGIVPDDYINAWGWLTLDDVGPLYYLLRPIFDEMEASGWTHSESWEQFNEEKIVEALQLARDGKLEELLYGKKTGL